jgi:membrane associated rhomboid family serine protease
LDTSRDSEWQEASDSPSPAKAPVCWSIIAICIVLYILSNALHILDLDLLVFSPANAQSFPQVLSHIFAHADLAHIVSNMLGLYLLGTIVEQKYGTVRFVTLFLVSGLLAALAQVVFYPGSALLGASGAIAGVVAAFVRNYPLARLYVLGVVPLPAWLFIFIWVIFNIVGVGHGESNIAFLAHLGGFLAGWLLTFLLSGPDEKPRASRLAG